MGSTGAVASPVPRSFLPRGRCGGVAFATQSKSRANEVPLSADETFGTLSKQGLIFLTSGAVDSSRRLFVCGHTGVILASPRDAQEPHEMLLSRASGKAGRKKGTYTHGVSSPLRYHPAPGSRQSTTKGRRQGRDRDAAPAVAFQSTRDRWQMLNSRSERYLL